MKKGTTNNPNGRPAGVPNKLTAEMRAVLKGIIERELEGLPARLDALESEKRLDVLLKLLPYALPKVESVHPAVGEPLSLDW